MQTLIQAGIPQVNVDLKVKVSTDPNDTYENLNRGEAREQGYFELAEDDLRSAFSEFGQIVQIKLHVKFDCAVITYRHLLSAIMALMSFHKRPLPNDNAYLLLFILSTKEDDSNEDKLTAPVMR